MDDPTLTRRDVLKVTAFGATVLALPLTATLSAKQASQLAQDRLPRPYAVPFTRPPVARVSPRVRVPGQPWPVYELRMERTTARIAPGLTTEMWGYRDLNNPDTPIATFPGPTIVTQQNRPVVVRQINALPDEHPVFHYLPTTSVHHHGHPSRPQYDGYANDTTAPGQFKDYVYENNEDARTTWYHDHAVHHTAPNVYWGLAAQYHIDVPTETRLPTGDFDWPLIINDIALTADGQLLYDDRSHAGPMGDIVLANGRPWPVMTVQPRRYHFRVLNASIARGYRLRLSDGGPMTVVSTDGGQLPVPARVTELKIGMAERYGVVIDFSRYPGRRVELRNLGVPNTIDYPDTDKVMAFDVAPGTVPNIPEPRPLTDAEIPAVMRLTEGDAQVRRTLRFERQNGLWTINGQIWEDVVESGFTETIAHPAPGGVELWTLENRSGGWFHPIHVHLVDFRVLDRNGLPPAPYERGPKDVVYLGEGETVRIIARYGPHQGRYMLHCHNNTHEDNDMMHQFEVGQGGPDPITTARPHDVGPDGATPAQAIVT